MTAVLAPSARSPGPAASRAVVLDASRAFADRIDPDLAGLRHLADGTLRLAGAIRVDGSRIVGLTRAALAARLAGPAQQQGDRDAAFAAIRAWLLGELPSPVGPTARRPLRVRGRFDGLSRLAAPPPFAPHGSVLLRAGLSGWDDAVLQRWLDARRDLAPVGLLAAPLALDFPEYAAPGEQQAVEHQLAGLARLAKALVVPGEVSRSRIAAAMVAKGRRNLPIHMEPEPSRLAGTLAPHPDPELAAVPYVVVAGPIEARGNVPLLLNLWRDLVLAGETVPKLVLAGERGRQIEESRPLLDWGETIRPHVREAPGLGPQGLRDLLGHARAVLAPAFWMRSGALVRDAARLGVPVVASDIPVHRELPDGTAALLNPIDGPAWREAVLAVGRTPRPAAAAAPLLDWDHYGSGLMRFLATL